MVRSVDAGTVAAGIDSGCCRTVRSPASRRQVDQLHRSLADAAAGVAGVAAAADADTSAAVVD